MTTNKTTEHTTQNAIIRYLAMHDGVRVFRQNTGRATIRGHATALANMERAITARASEQAGLFVGGGS